MITRANCEDSAVTLEYDLADIVREEIGFNEIFAGQIAAAIVRGMRKKFRGQDVYIPAPDKTERDAAIRREFNGRNIEEVCKKHGLSRPHIYRIVGKR